MSKPTKSLGLCASFCALASLSVLITTEAAAQRRGGGGRAGASSMSRSSMSGASSRQVRSSASGNINHGRSNTQLASASSGNRTNINTGNVNTLNSNTNISGNNINTGDVNINRGDVNIDVDGGYGCCGWGNWDYHPVAVGVAVGTAAAVTTAWRLGAYYSTLPTSCVVIYRGTVTYYQCGSYWYQPMYSGMTVQYVAVVAPK